MFALAVVTFLAASQPASAGDRWICLHSPNFELYTTDSEKAAREAIELFEQVRTAFTEILGVKLPDDKPVTIVAFRDEAEYAPYRYHDGVTAYTMSQPSHDYIVIQDLLPEHQSMLLHEYTHVIINQAGIKLPLWLNEGFAELYGTMKPVGRNIRVGRVIPGRLQMARSGLTDLHEILRADSHSAAYHENDRIGIFYAESWALTHMLKFSKDYSGKFDRFLDAIGRGQPSDAALEAVYGKPIASIQADLWTYVNGDHFYEGVIKGRLEKSHSDPVEVPVDALKTAVMLAGIQAHGQHRAEAIKTLEKLAQENPKQPLPYEALAWIQLGGSSPQAAIEPFQRALEFGTRDASLCLTFAIQARPSIPAFDYLAALRRATEIDSNLSAAQKLLAAYYFNHQDYAQAVARLHQVKKLERGQAFAYYSALSVAAFKIGNSEEAKSAASRAQEHALTAEERRKATELWQYVSGGQPSQETPKIDENPPPQYLRPSPASR